jgi:hypothetical protein
LLLSIQKSKLNSSSIGASQFFQSFQRLSGWSFGALLLPPMLLAMTICSLSLALAFAWQLPFRREVWRASYWLAFTQFLFFPAIITVGVLLPAGGIMPKPVPNMIGRWCLEALWYLSLALGCLWVYRMKKLRWFAISLVAVQEILILCAGFMAGMSVSGDWL